MRVKFVHLELRIGIIKRESPLAITSNAYNLMCHIYAHIYTPLTLCTSFTYVMAKEKKHQNWSLRSTDKAQHYLDSVFSFLQIGLQAFYLYEMRSWTRINKSSVVLKFIFLHQMKPGVPSKFRNLCLHMLHHIWMRLFKVLYLHIPIVSGFEMLNLYNCTNKRHKYMYVHL